MYRLPALLAALTAMSAVEAQAAGPVRVGVVVNLRVNVSPDEAAALSEKLARAIRSAQDVDVVAGKEVDRRLAPEGVPEDCVARGACVSQVAARLDADELLFLVLVKIGDTIQIDSTWARPGVARTLSRDQIVLDGRPEDQVFALAAKKILPPAKRKQPPPPPPPNKPPVKRVPDRAPDGVVAQGPSSPPGFLPVVISAGVSALTLTAGLGLALSSRSDHERAVLSDCNAGAGNCSVREQILLQEELDVLGKKGMFTNLLFGAAAVGGIATTLLYLDYREAQKVTVAPTEDGAQLVWGGSF